MRISCASFSRPLYEVDVFLSEQVSESEKKLAGHSLTAA
jgi:hypothetical protein